jgi:hypothetical protein
VLEDWRARLILVELRKATEGTLKMRMLCADPEEKQPSMYGAQLKLQPGKKIELIMEPMDQQ